MAGRHIPDPEKIHATSRSDSHDEAAYSSLQFRLQAVRNRREAELQLKSVSHFLGKMRDARVSWNLSVAPADQECYIMPNKDQKFEANVPGRYYVSGECIGCTLCAEIAPENFAINTAEELEVVHDYVCKQPGTAQEDEFCAEAMAACPANAIGIEA